MLKLFISVPTSRLIIPGFSDIIPEYPESHTQTFWRYNLRLRQSKTMSGQNALKWGIEPQFLPIEPK